MQAATADTFAALTSRGLVLVKYWADWCHPCTQIGAAVSSIAAVVPSLTIVTINVDEQKALALKNNVRAIPALHLYRDGKFVAASVGIGSAAKIRKNLSL